MEHDYRGFDLDRWLGGLNPRLMATSEGRRILTRLDPMAFAYTYTRSHLHGPETNEQITFSEFHLDVYRQAALWPRRSTLPAANRDAYVAPRSASKSTMFFLILPLWLACHQHEDFIAAFADSGSQAEMHLASFKRELETNELLRMDFPDLCTPAKRARGTTEADNRGMLITSSGFVFGARGIDASSLGMKVGRRRPGLLLGDDLEPGEETYSAYQAEKRLGALIDSVLPLNVYARVVLVGTVTMPGSIIHQLVKTVTVPDEPPAQWIVDEKFRTHYYPAILTDPATGEERSLWPAKWPMSYLESIRHTRQYKKNYANDPAGRDGDYWNAEDFVYGEVPALTHQLLSIDPAVTAKKKSDFTALAVVGYSASEQRCVVRWARAVRIQPGAPLRDMVARVLEQFPDIRGVLIETNQGGDVWQSVLHGLPVPIRTVHQSEAKEVRAARLLNFYQRRRGGLPLVMHERRIPAAEEQMIAFPKGANDDLVDCIGTGVDVFLRRGKRAGGSSVDPRYGHEAGEDEDS